MKKQALILQGWFNSPQDNWYPWLKQELEKRGYQVFLEELPTIKTDVPKMQQQLSFIEGKVKFDKDTVVIGHSLGALLALRLAEKNKYGTMILVAGWDFDDLTKGHEHFWPNKLNHQEIKNNIDKIFCLSSDNDPYMTAFQVEEMSKRLDGKFILIKNAGHFGGDTKTKKIPQLLKYI